MSTFSFNKIAILESLSEGERKTGRQLYDDLEMVKIGRARQLNTEYKSVSSKIEFFAYIETLRIGAEVEETFPVLQIEAHGTNDLKGLILSSGDVIRWEEMAKALRPLNYLCRCNLLVVIAACYGANLLRIMSITDHAPFWGVIAPEYEILPNQIYESMYRFYVAVYDGKTGQALIDTLKTAGDFNGLKLVTSEYLFVRAYEYYVDNECSPLALEARAKRVREMSIQKGIKNPLNVKQIMEQLEPTEQHFNKCIDTFFMLADYPENIDKISTSVKTRIALKIKGKQPQQ